MQMSIDLPTYHHPSESLWRERNNGSQGVRADTITKEPLWNPQRFFCRLGVSLLKWQVPVLLVGEVLGGLSDGQFLGEPLVTVGGTIEACCILMTG